jgi:hypothetical protein
VVATTAALAAGLAALAPVPAHADETLDPQRDVHPFGDAAALSGVVPSMGLVAMARTPTGQGYWLAASDGGVFAYGDATFFGSRAGQGGPQVSGMAATPTGRGYWLVAADGGIFAYGDATFHGSTGNIRLNQQIVGMAATPTGAGYWLVAADGGIFAFGDAAFHGSTGSIRLNQRIVGMAATPTGAGYWLVAADGGIFAFGDAAFLGSTGHIRLDAGVKGMAATPTGRGYWLAADDGGVFAFGDAAFLGSAAGRGLTNGIVAVAATPTGAGYWLAAGGGCGVIADTSDKADTAPQFRVHQTDLTVSVVRCVDRITFTFGSEAPAGEPPGIGWEVGYDPGPFLNPAGDAVPAPGPVFLKVRFFPASRADFSQDPIVETYTGPTDLRPSSPRGVRAIQFVEDFEAVLVWVISLDHVHVFRVIELSDPPRLIVDVV